MRSLDRTYPRKTRPLYLKRVGVALVPSSRRSPAQSGDRTDKWAIVPISGRSLDQVGVNLKKQEKCSVRVQVSAESVVIGHQKSVKLARPLDLGKSVA